MSKVYLDSCMVIGLIEGDAKQRQILKTQCINHTIYSSELVRMETRLLAVRNKDTKSLEMFELFFIASEIVNLDRAVFERATLLRAETNLKTPDALHLSAAIEAGCEELWTNDKQLVATAGHYLKVMDWIALDSCKSSFKDKDKT